MHDTMDEVMTHISGWHFLPNGEKHEIFKKDVSTGKFYELFLYADLNNGFFSYVDSYGCGNRIDQRHNDLLSSLDNGFKDKRIEMKSYYENVNDKYHLGYHLNYNAIDYTEYSIAQVVFLNQNNVKYGWMSMVTEKFYHGKISNSWLKQHFETKDLGGIFLNLTKWEKINSLF